MKEKNIIRRFDQVKGGYVDTIKGQDKFGYAFDDLIDLYETQEIFEHSGKYKGNVLSFYDFETGEVFTPFSLKENVAYSSPYYYNDKYYFLKVDYGKSKIELLAYNPGESVSKEETFELKEFNLYNLALCGLGLNIISEDGNEFVSHFPRKFSLELPPEESVLFIDDNRLYISAWVEEGYDEKAGVATEDYKYYEKFIVRDFEGNLISEEVGSLFQSDDGTWWLS